MALTQRRFKRSFTACLLGLSIALGGVTLAAPTDSEEPIAPPTVSEREAGFLYRQGVELLGAGESVRAEVLLRDALRLEPERLEIRPYLATALAEQGHWEQALAQLNAYLSLEPTDVRVELMRVRALSALSRGAEAEDSWARLGYEGLSGSWEWHNLGGYLAETSGDLTAAEARYLQAVELNPDEVEPRVNLVALYLKQERVAEAGEMVGNLLEDAPEDQQVLNAFALLLSEQEPGYDLALLRERLKERVLGFELQYNLVVALLERSELGEAGILAGDLLDRFPDHPRAQWLYGRMLLKRGDLQEARKYLQASFPRLPRNSEILETMGFLELASGGFEESASWYGQAAELKPDDPWPLHSMAVALGRADRFDEAISASRKAIALEPTEPRFVYQLALALDRAGRRPEAATEFQKFLQSSEDEALKASVREHLTEMRPELPPR